MALNDSIRFTTPEFKLGRRLELFGRRRTRRRRPAKSNFNKRQKREVLGILGERRYERRTVYVRKKIAYRPIQTATIVPSTNNRNQPISMAERRRRVQQTRREMARLFGGYTAVSAEGGWYDDKQKHYVNEPATVVYAYATRADYRRNKGKWVAWVRRKKKAWGQGEMGIIIENDMVGV